MKQLRFFTLLLLLLPMVAWSNSSAVRLGQLLQDVRAIEADFMQFSFRNLDQGMDLISEAEGRMWLQYPDQVYWQAEEPVMQVVLADGKHLYVWDQDLEQVTREPLGDRLKASPASILISGPDAIRRDFKVSEQELTEGIESYELIPWLDNELYTRLVLSFVAGKPKEVQIFDTLGNATMLIFNDLNINPEIAADRFSLQVPEYTDWIIVGD